MPSRVSTPWTPLGAIKRAPGRPRVRARLRSRVRPSGLKSRRRSTPPSTSPPGPTWPTSPVFRPRPRRVRAKGIARRHRRLPQRDRAVPQPVFPLEKPETDEEFKARIRPRAARARDRPCRWHPGSRGGPGLLPGERRRRRPRGLDRRRPPHRALGSRSSPAEGAVPLYRRLLPADRERRGRSGYARS